MSIPSLFQTLRVAREVSRVSGPSAPNQQANQEVSLRTCEPVFSERVLCELYQMPLRAGGASVARSSANLRSDIV
eukprot:s284_g7.t1